MVVLGVDPGFGFSGYSIFNENRGIVILLECGLIRLKSSDSLATRIKIFYDHFLLLIERFSIEKINLETSFLYKNPQVFLKLGYLRGILYLIAAQKTIIIEEFTPKQIKLIITGSGSASKEQVARVLLKLFPRIQSFDKDDISDAVAIGLSGIWSKKN